MRRRCPVPAERIPPDELARRLAARMQALAPELIPRGRRQGAEWVAGDLAGSAGGSLSIRLTGAKAGVWRDFSTDAGGDALALVAAVRFNGAIGPAMQWARAWLGISDEALPPSAEQRQADITRRQAAANDDAERRRRHAVALFLEAQERIAGTPAEAYLRGRAIELAELGRQPRCLRFHPACWCTEAQAKLPALLAAIHDAEGTHVATHRTWLAHRQGEWGKAAVPNPKKTIGSYAGGSIRLWRGSSGRSLRDAPAGEACAVAEGIETALSVAIARPDLRVLAAVSLANMARLELPEAIATVILCADNDGCNDQAAALVVAAARRLAGQGRAVRIARAPDGKDFNDTLRAGDQVARASGSPA
jgi:hypothetical protein